MVPHEFDGPSFDCERFDQRVCEWANVTGWNAWTYSHERVDVSGLAVGYPKCYEGRAARERES